MDDPHEPPRDPEAADAKPGWATVWLGGRGSGDLPIGIQARQFGVMALVVQLAGILLVLIVTDPWAQQVARAIGYGALFTAIIGIYRGVRSMRGPDATAAVIGFMCGSAVIILNLLGILAAILTL